MTHFLVEQLRTSDPGLLQWTETVQTVNKCETVSVKAVAAESEGMLLYINLMILTMLLLNEQQHVISNQSGILHV